MRLATPAGSHPYLYLMPLKKSSFISDSSSDLAPGMGGTHQQAGVELTGCAGGFQPALPSCRSRPPIPSALLRETIEIPRETKPNDVADELQYVQQ